MCINMDYTGAQVHSTSAVHLAKRIYVWRILSSRIRMFVLIIFELAELG